MLSVRTLTRGSPMKPSTRPSSLSLIAWSTCPTGTPRAWAIPDAWSRAYAGEQARLGVLVLLAGRDELRVRQRVDDALGTEVARGRRGRVVAVAGVGGTALEVLLEGIPLVVREGLADDPAADDLPVGGLDHR